MRRNLRETLSVLLLAAFAHLSLLGFVALASRYGGNLGTGTEFWTNAIAHWDAHHYLRIAQVGYREKQLLAFFPLFPALTRLVSALGIGLLPASLLVNFVCHVAGAAVFFRLVRLDYPRQTAWRALELFLVYPAALMFVAPYSEPVAFLSIILSVYWFRGGKYGLAAAAGFLAGLSRATGWLVGPLLLVEALSCLQTRSRWAAWVPGVAPFVGLGGYLTLNAWVAGDPLAFLAVQSQMFHRTIAWPTAGLAWTWATLNRGWPEWLTFGVANLAGVALAWLAVVGSAWGGGRRYGAYCLLFATLVTFQSRWSSVLRYDAMLFPLFVFLAGNRRTIRTRVLVSIFVVALLFFAFEYAHGRWAM